MNINIDNYEAYLLDYMEGNLSPDETRQLQVFVAAQGLDWDELTEELPRLEAPQIKYADKERLKKKGVVVPLYAKIASAAAAAGLLLTVGLWPEKQLPKMEPIADMKPIEAQVEFTENAFQPLPRKIIAVQPNVKERNTMPQKQATLALIEVPSLTSREAVAIASTTVDFTPQPDMMLYQMEDEFAMTQEENIAPFEEELPSSLIGKGIFRLTEGRHDSFGSLILSGLHTAKEEVNLAATDFALTAYYRADEHFEEAKERWEEKRGE